MNTMSVNATAARLHAAVADARDTAQAFVEDLRQPNDSKPKHAPGSQPPHMRTSGLSCGTGEPYGPVSRGFAIVQAARAGRLHRIRSHAEA